MSPSPPELRSPINRARTAKAIAPQRRAENPSRKPRVDRRANLTVGGPRLMVVTSYSPGVSNGGLNRNGGTDTGDDVDVDVGAASTFGKCAGGDASPGSWWAEAKGDVEGTST